MRVEDQDSLERLENAASAVTEADEHLAKKLGSNAAFEQYLRLALTRLRPILTYDRHYPEAQVLSRLHDPSRHDLLILN